MPPKLAKLLGLGAFGASAGLLTIYLGLIFLSRPRSSGGIDAINSAVAWIALGGVFAALIIVHVVIGKRLLLLSDKPGVRHPL